MPQYGTRDFDTSRPIFPQFQPEQELSGESVSFSIRRRLNNMFSVVASAALFSPRGPFWSVGFVAEDKTAGLESVISYNYQVRSKVRAHKALFQIYHGGLVVNVVPTVIGRIHDEGLLELLVVALRPQWR